MCTRADSSVRVDYARHDPVIALVSLFRPICRGRRPGGLTIEYERYGLQLKFNLWQALDTRDQSVLLAAIGLAGRLAHTGEAPDLTRDVTHPRGQRLWLDLEPNGQAIMDFAIVIRTSRYALLRIAGLDDKGRNYTLLEDSLERLSMVGCRARKDGYDWSMRLLSYTETPEGRIHIALNSRFATALSGQYAYISLNERRLLRGDTALLVHAWLSAWLRQGRTNCIRLDRLTENVWGLPSKSPSTTRGRRERITKGLQEVGKLKGWEVKIEGRGANAMATIKRPLSLRQK